MGYTPSSKTFAKCCISKICIVEGQSLVLKESPQRHHVDFLRSAARCRTTTLPQSMPAQQAEDSEKTPQMIDLSIKPFEIPCEGTEKREIMHTRSQLRQQALALYRDQCAEEEYNQQVSKKPAREHFLRRVPTSEAAT